MKNLIFFSCLLFMISCKKEEVGQTKSFIKNSTSHSIKLMPYNGGIFDSTNIKTITSNTTIEMYSANVRGKTVEPCFGTLLQPYDSVVIVYDNLYKIPHIKFNGISNAPKKVLFTSSRNISNAANWTKKITNETKYSLEGNFEFTFIEQDYIDAL